MIYRNWTISEAAWTRRGTVATRLAAKQFPRWLLEAPVWCHFWTKHGVDAKLNVQHALTLRRLLGFLVVAFWYGWNDEMFDTAYPKYTASPRFRSNVQAMQAAGIRVVPYINGHMYDPSTGGADVAATHACHSMPSASDPQLRPYREVYHPAPQNISFIVMDPSQTWWQQTLVNVLSTLVREYGVNGIYID